jgi:hypothetical protein
MRTFFRFGAYFLAAFPAFDERHDGGLLFENVSGCDS